MVFCGFGLCGGLIEREHADDYKQLIDELIEKGFRIQVTTLKLPKNLNKL